MFTRKHYIKVAEALSESRERINAHDSELTRDIGNELLDEWTQILADEFENDNPNFDRSRFMHACGEISVT